MEVTLVLVMAIFAINVYLARQVLDSFLFSLALVLASLRNCCRQSSASTLPTGPNEWRKQE